MANIDDEDGGSLRVRDLRRFDSEGNERDAAVNSAAVAPDESPALKPSPATSKNANAPESTQIKPDSKSDGATQPKSDQSHHGSDSSSGPQIDFRSFIISLATQALMQLGEIDPPPGMEMPKDKAAAKQTIDILIMLHEKTKGNLEADEDKLLEEILHNLRLSFVRAV